MIHSSASHRELRVFDDHTYVNEEIPPPLLRDDGWWNNALPLCKRYREVLGLPPYQEGDDDPIKVHQSWGAHPTPLMIHIRLDGYEVDFVHDGTFVIPPPSQWTRQTHEDHDPRGITV